MAQKVEWYHVGRQHRSVGVPAGHVVPAGVLGVPVPGWSLGGGSVAAVGVCGPVGRGGLQWGGRRQ